MNEHASIAGLSTSGTLTHWFKNEFAKEIKGDDVKVVPILTSQDALDAVGQITKAEIKYPGKNTKNISVKLQADSPLFGPSQYDVVGRNTQGKILPMSLRITKTK